MEIPRPLNADFDAIPDCIGATLDEEDEIDERIERLQRRKDYLESRRNELKREFYVAPASESIRNLWRAVKP